jgi:hypothetical protein
MKTYPFLFALLLISSLTFAQNTPADSSIIVASPASASHYGKSVAPQDLYVKGRLNAETHYKKYKGAATGTLIASLVSPLIGLIPAIACSATTPRIENLGYPDEKLFMQKEYCDSYTRRAKKIKAGKVWKNWGIGFGVNIVAVLIISASAR